MTDFEALTRFRAYPPLVFAGECDLLMNRMARAARGEAFVLHVGDRTRTAAHMTADAIRARFRTLLQMAAVLTYATAVPVVKIGCFDLGGPGPSGAVGGYERSAAALNLMRALASGGEGDLRQVHEWNREFVSRSPARERHAVLVAEIGKALAFMRACGPDPAHLSTVEFFAAQEGLPQAYESALTRVDSRTGHLYNTSGHFVRTGDRTPAHDGRHGEHEEYCAAIRNPLGVAVGPGTTPDGALALLDRLNPGREPGRLAFLVRMGADDLYERLPALIEKVTAEDHKVAWICELTTRDGSGEGAGDGAAHRPHRSHRPRHLDDLLDEVTAFFDVHRSLGVRPAGLATDLSETRSAPLDLAFLVAELWRSAGPWARSGARATPA
ncbi:3-deoxy-7-phosphoheptulonate synthase [Streptomyces sp. NPDC086080]|uniref:3-deoxy-7-phosphoheptulonate synthase n=1 Tax=Streptomyces sp. NPDC086080 TaxID=3365748 RepID=UPI0037CF04A5